MRVKQISIKGFKSYVDHTVFKFPHALTGIVGPNGCGKSNLVDAVRWAFGEQSAKTLRGSEMEDVIFVGSDNRPPMDEAEVSITFSDVNIEGQSEVVITRKLNRSGDGLYLMNHTPCRLKDITDFFSGTGVGAKGYSIIEQGQVDRILNSKAQERRWLIDEVAGIGKYKAKKSATLKEIEIAKQNLERVNDVLNEVDRQLRSLSRQAKKAERYISFKEELKSLEVKLALSEYLNLTNLSKEKLDLSNSFEEEVLLNQNKIDSKKKEIDIAKLQLEEFLNQLESLKERQRISDKTINELKGKITISQNELDAIDRLNTKNETEINLLSEKIKELKEQLDKSEILKKEYEKNFSDHFSEIEVKENYLQEISSQLDEILEEIKDEKKVSFDLNSKLITCQNKISNLESDKLESQEKIAKLESEEILFKKKSVEIQESINILKDNLTKDSAEKAQITKRLKEETENLSNILKKADEIGEQLEKLKKEINGNQLLVESYKKLILGKLQNGVKSIINAELSGIIKGLVADIIEVEKEYETIIEDYLREKLQYIIVKDASSGIEGVKYLKAQEGGRCTFIPTTLRDDLRNKIYSSLKKIKYPFVVGPALNFVKIKKLNEIVEFLLGDVLIVKDLESAFNFWKNNKVQFTMLTLSGEVLRPSGIFTGGGEDKEKVSILEKQREIRELEEKIEISKRIFENLHIEYNELDIRLSETRKLIIQFREKSHSLDLEILKSTKDFERLEYELAQSEKKLLDIKHEKNIEIQKLTEINKKIESAKLESENIEKLLLEQDDKLEDLENKSKELKNLIDEIEESITTLKLEKVANEAKYSSIVSKLKEFENSKLNLEKTQKKLELEIVGNQSKKEKLLEEYNKYKLELEKVENLKKEADEILISKESLYKEKKEKLKELEEEYNKLFNQFQHLQQLFHNEKIYLTELKVRLEELEKQIKDKYNIVIKEIITPEDKILNPSEKEEISKRIEEIKQIIEKMGEINPTAIQEYKEIKERYDFLDNQRKDLKKSIEDLNLVILRINKESKIKFKETFDAVNAKFQELFPRLFKGGKAELILTDKDNLLETGIEIVAEPPGKKLQKINLLSGGEKALTAISLIFSIFMIKPSPFCLLDEVDAPLDDANVDRFNALLTELTKETQFIIISHNKKTMEHVETLYGITMQEPGVSKIVSVKLN